MLDVLAFDHLAGVANLDLGPDRARGGNRRDLVIGEGPLGEDGQHLASDIARGSDNCHPITHDTCFLVRE